MTKVVWFISPPSLSQFGLVVLLALAAAKSVHGQPRVESSSAKSATLQVFAGRYQASADTIIMVRHRGDGLALEVNSTSPMEFSPDSDGHFVHKESGTRISFVRDGQGKVTDLILYRGGEHRAKRISEAPSSEQVRSVTVDGSTFQTLITGEGNTTVVLVSGLNNWAKVAAGIEKEARVIRYHPDASHAGKAAPKDGRSQARMLHELLKALQLAKPSILVGHSFDGALIRIYADLYPEDVGALILVDPFHEEFVDWLKANQPKNYDLFRRQALKHYVSDWDDFLGRLRGTRLPTGIPVVLLTAGRRQLRENNALESQVTSADFEAGATAVMKAHKAWIAAVPNGRHEIVPDVGHEIPKEQPAFVIKAIKQTLNDMKERNR